jgi:hypothetical protein
MEGIKVRSGSVSISNYLHNNFFILQLFIFEIKIRTKKRKPIWWGIIFVFFYYLFSSFLHFHFHFLSFFVCDSRKINVCEVREENYTCVKKHYNGFWLKVKGLFFFECIALIS